MINSPKDQCRVNGVQYRLQYRKCGKPGCKCATGEGHGPYWYAYSDHGPAKYVGGQLPDHVTKHLELLKSSGTKLKALKAKINQERAKAREALDKADLELRTISNLEAGEYAASEVLKSLGLAQFNGHGKH